MNRFVSRGEARQGAGCAVAFAKNLIKAIQQIRMLFAKDLRTSASGDDVYSTRQRRHVVRQASTRSGIVQLQASMKVGFIEMDQTD